MLHTMTTLLPRMMRNKTTVCHNTHPHMNQEKNETERDSMPHFYPICFIFDFKMRLKVYRRTVKRTPSSSLHLFVSLEFSLPTLDLTHLLHFQEMAHLVSSGDGLVVTVDRESGRGRCVGFTLCLYLSFTCDGLLTAHPHLVTFQVMSCGVRTMARPLWGCTSILGTRSDTRPRCPSPWKRYASSPFQPTTWQTHAQR